MIELGWLVSERFEEKREKGENGRTQDKAETERKRA